MSIEKTREGSQESSKDVQVNAVSVDEVVTPAVPAQAHTKKQPSGHRKGLSGRHKWKSVFGLSLGVLALVMLLVSGVLSQYFKGKMMPGVSVAGMAVGAQKPEAVQAKLQQRLDEFKLSLGYGEKKMSPALDEIGVTIEVEKTVENGMHAKRHSGFLKKLQFWQRYEVPALVSIDESTLEQYLYTHAPELSKSAQDARLEFSAQQGAFIITPQADGEGPNVNQLRQQIEASAGMLEGADITIKTVSRAPKITEKQLAALAVEANGFTRRKVMLTSLGASFTASSGDIAAWITPTPQADGSMKLVLDSAKVQSYVDAIGQRIASAPQDRKVLRDAITGSEVVLQEGRVGTALADGEKLAKAITEAVRAGKDISQPMQIISAEFKTVSMEAFDRWVEVDLRNQRTTLYTGATPVHTFVISSGLPRTPTVTGEFKVWHKTAKQTMSGGSRAGGDYYSLPNVTWNTFFHQDYAFHTAYWHNNFGQPMSRGCVNMRDADAKILYDFAPIGTTVIVHG